MSDNVNHPWHYNQGDIEVIDIIESWGLGFCLGSALKYALRAPHKGNAKQDYEKALWCIKRFRGNSEQCYHRKCYISPIDALHGIEDETIGMLVHAVCNCAAHGKSTTSINVIENALYKMIGEDYE